MPPKKRNAKNVGSLNNCPKVKRSRKCDKNNGNKNDGKNVNETSLNKTFRDRRLKQLNGTKNDTKSHKSIITHSEYFSSPQDTDHNDNGNDNLEKIEPMASTSLMGNHESNESESSESDHNDWETVQHEKYDEFDDYDPEIPTEGIEITMKEPINMMGKKKKSIDFNALIRQHVNRTKKEVQLNKHKTCLLMFISRLNYLNSVINNSDIRGLSLSIAINECPSFNAKRVTRKMLMKILKWFRVCFDLQICKLNDTPLLDSLCTGFAERKAWDVTELILLFISLLRCFECLNVRLCYALFPVDIKASDLILSDIQRQRKSKANGNGNNNGKGKVKKRNASSKTRIKKGRDEVILISDSDDTIIDNDENEKVPIKTEIWAEVYIECEHRWVCVDVVNTTIDEPMQLANTLLQPVYYVIAIDNENDIRDVTPRYVENWFSNTMKNGRVDKEWWNHTLRQFQRVMKNDYVLADDEEFERIIAAKPLPDKVSDYKHHPLYALKKDLLKFEAIYPSDAPPLGFFKGEPVYARECVQTLHSRETWLRHARTVRDGESPYKIVKSRPKWDKYAGVVRRDLPLEVFGEWQTSPFEPPEAANGKVPRNKYGNVDLFQQCMLPKGTVHLQLPGLLRIANKLKIDCAPAVVGFDAVHHGAVPVNDGFIVCEEFKDVLIMAWDEEQDNARRRGEEKKLKRVYDNWKKLIKGLLIRERVKMKYMHEADHSPDTG